ncbi:MAG: TMEM175 family protein [Acidobacteriota bacterium]
MGKNRMEAFSDGVLAIIITIMVLELKAPESAELSALRPLLPVFLAYVLSFTYVGIYWNNHHHLLHTVSHVSAGILWANLHLLFWLSLLPFTTAWMGESSLHANHAAPVPTAAYGLDLLMAAIAYYLLQRAILTSHGKNSTLAIALGRDWKGKLSPLIYLAAMGLAFVNPLLSNLLYAGAALMWVVPDRRIERVMAGREE